MADTHTKGFRRRYEKLEDVPAWLLARYEHGQYLFSAPPVCTAYWDTLSWINYVLFIGEPED